jgi:hypothetical protein
MAQLGRKLADLATAVERYYHGWSGTDSLFAGGIPAAVTQ